MRVVFMGSPAPAIHPLRSLLNAQEAKEGLEVVAVVSQRAKPAGRGRTLLDPPVAAFAKAQGLMVLQPEKARDPEFLDELRKLEPDVIVTCAYGQILTEAFLAIPKRATINVHPSMLPLLRGATPVQSALWEGFETTGVSILFTVKALDAGNIIVQAPFAVGPEETSAGLMDRLFLEGGSLLLQAIVKLRDPDFMGEPQDPHKVTECRKLQKDDGLVDWSLPVAVILQRYRACDPWPSTFTFLGRDRIVLERLHPLSTPEDERWPLQLGAFVYHKPSRRIVIRAENGWLEASVLRREGGKSLAADAFWNGLARCKEFVFGSTKISGG
jgi:methionyl-tRNA formyltransferase